MYTSNMQPVLSRSFDDDTTERIWNDESNKDGQHIQDHEQVVYPSSQRIGVPSMMHRIGLTLLWICVILPTIVQHFGLNESSSIPSSDTSTTSTERPVVWSRRRLATQRLVSHIQERWSRHRQLMTIMSSDINNYSNSEDASFQQDDDQYDGITLILKGNRVDLLHQSLESISYCNDITNIQIDWTESEDTFPDVLVHFHNGRNGMNVTKAIKLTTFSRRKSKQNAYKFSTDALLLLDERIRLSCSELAAAFDEWKVDPTRIIGIDPTYFTSTTSFLTDQYKYNLVSDRAAIVHRHYYTNFKFNKKPKSIRRQKNHKSLMKNDNIDICEQYSLSAYVSFMTEQNPAILAAKESKIAVVEPPEGTSLFDVFTSWYSQQDCMEIIPRTAGASSTLTPVAVRIIGRGNVDNMLSNTPKTSDNITEAIDVQGVADAVAINEIQ
jgi:hypothetical protein